MLKKGDKAPNFNLPDENGKIHNLSEYAGEWVLVYFYPKDFTSGCTKEACLFRDNFSKLQKLIQILGISADSENSHKKFSEKYGLPFTLLSDTAKNTIKEYEANGLIFAKRVSFLINPDGVIEKVYDKVNPEIHAQQILKDLSELKKS